jgi:hypothetical protein
VLVKDARPPPLLLLLLLLVVVVVLLLLLPRTRRVLPARPPASGTGPHDG